MKVLVCVKQVKVLGDEVEFTKDGRDVDPDYLEHALNEWDACALEEALRGTLPRSLNPQGRHDPNHQGEN
ncbi:MAG TPA: hypothetical protein VGU71_06155 [Candidatus Dormibacteraeota bacterium]|nr:hypothetical protein [Candidatus Dormibacteraeota bacterium]